MVVTIITVLVAQIITVCRWYLLESLLVITFLSVYMLEILVFFYVEFVLYMALGEGIECTSVKP